jgi:hypothetical protein
MWGLGPDYRSDYPLSELVKTGMSYLAGAGWLDFMTGYLEGKVEAFG